MALNRKLLNEVLDLIDNHPKLWDQSLWVDEEKTIKIAQKNYDPDRPELCGTTACVAGWAVMKSKEYTPVFSRRHIISFVNKATGADIKEEGDEADVDGYQAAGARLLGLTDTQAEKIFVYMSYASDKPHTFTDRVRKYLHMRTKWGTTFWPGEHVVVKDDARDERDLVDA